jgi:hypothetical protein
MPCDTITTQSVNLANALPDLLRSALEADGWILEPSKQGTIVAHSAGTGLIWTAGKGLELRGNRNAAEIRQITKAYSRKAVSWAAQRAGWSVKQTTDDTLSVSRR